MVMKWSIIKWGIGLFLFVTSPLCAQQDADSIRIKEREAHRLARQERLRARYERKLMNYQTTWQKLIPKYQKLQFAGSIGLISLGMGWDYGKRDQWETDFLIGFIPRFSSNEAKVTLTLKQNYIPWTNVYLAKRWSFDPLTTGIYVNTVLDDAFWVKEPDRYPSNYYKFSTRVRFHVFIGQRLTFGLDRSAPFKKMTVFYEFSTCDLYFISAVGNRYIGLGDILSLSFGIKLQIL